MSTVLKFGTFDILSFAYFNRLERLKAMEGWLRVGVSTDVFSFSCTPVSAEYHKSLFRMMLGLQLAPDFSANNLV